MELHTPFDVALAELLRAWRTYDDARRREDTTLRELTAAWLQLDRARSWVRAFPGVDEPVTRRGPRPTV